MPLIDQRMSDAEERAERRAMHDRGPEPEHTRSVRAYLRLTELRSPDYITDELCLLLVEHPLTEESVATRRALVAQMRGRSREERRALSRAAGQYDVKGSELDVWAELDNVPDKELAEALRTARAQASAAEHAREAWLSWHTAALVAARSQLMLTTAGRAWLDWYDAPAVAASEAAEQLCERTE
jgi:hypothetical protein